MAGRVVADLNGPLPGGADGYFRQAAEQIGTTSTNDFIFGAMHAALRAQLKQVSTTTMSPMRSPWLNCRCTSTVFQTRSAT